MISARTRLAVHQSSARADWLSPPAVLDPVRRFSGVGIGLDPCGHQASLVRAATEYRLARGEDGLVLSWRGRGLVYVNPPYGRTIHFWAQKTAEEAELGAEIVALLPARPDTHWWQRYVTTAEAILFWRGRLTFVGAEQGAPFPSALAYWGPRWRAFRDVLSPYGWIVFPGGRP